MPIPDTAFAQFPAQVHFLVAIESRKIDQPRFQVLELAPDFLNLLEARLQTPGCCVFPAAKLTDALPRRHHPAGECNALINVRKLGLILFVILFELNQAPEQAFYFGQESFGFEQIEETWHNVGEGGGHASNEMSIAAHRAFSL